MNFKKREVCKNRGLRGKNLSVVYYRDCGSGPGIGKGKEMISFVAK